METVIKGLEILVATTIILAVLFNFNRRIPRIPGDLTIDKLGFTIYIPFVSAVVVSIIITAFFNLLGSK